MRPCDKNLILHALCMLVLNLFWICLASSYSAMNKPAHCLIEEETSLLSAKL